MFLINVAHLRLGTLQIRRMFHTFAWPPLKFEECFTLLRRRYPKVTNVSHFRCFRASLSLGDVIVVVYFTLSLGHPDECLTFPSGQYQKWRNVLQMGRFQAFIPGLCFW